MLRASARELVKDRYPPERIAALADSDEGFPRDEWKAVADLGWVRFSGYFAWLTWLFA